MWVIVLLASLVVLIILVLCVPLEMVFHADVHGRLKFRLRLSWFFGLVSKELIRGKKKPGEKEKATEGKQKSGKRRGGTGLIFEVLRTKGLLRQTKGLLKDILSCFKVKKIKADFRVCLGDPADTGLFFALIGPAIPLLRFPFFNEISIKPSFEDDAFFAGYSYGRVRLRPISLATPILKFVFSTASIRAVKKVVSRKWKRKK